YLLNLSRGGTVDEEALVRALQEGWIRGAGIDVFDEEPARDNHPLYDMENVVMTPHIGGWVIEAMPRLSAVMAREMRTVLRGGRFESGDVAARDGAADDQQHVVGARRAEGVGGLLRERDVGTAEDAEADDLHVFLHRDGGDRLRPLPEAGVDDLEPRVAQCAR